MNKLSGLKNELRQTCAGQRDFMAYVLQYRLARFVDKKRAYIEFYVINPASGRLERQRVYLGHLNDAVRAKQAEKLVDLINQRLEKGWNPFDENLELHFTPISEALEKMKAAKLQYVSNRTKQTYTSKLKLLSDYLAKNKLTGLGISEFTGKYARALMQDLAKTGQAAPTYNFNLQTLKGFFSWFKENGYCNSNPFDGIRPARRVATVKRIWESEEIEALDKWSAANCPGLWVAGQLLYYSALRPAEIMLLKVHHLDFSAGMITLPAAASKTKKTRRVTMAGPLIRTLKEWTAGADKECYVIGRNIQVSAVSVHRNRLTEKFKECRAALGLAENLKFYWLKDTAAARLDQAGFSAVEIRDLFGHSSIAMTDKYLLSVSGRVNTKIRNSFPPLNE